MCDTNLICGRQMHLWLLAAGDLPLTSQPDSLVLWCLTYSLQQPFQKSHLLQVLHADPGLQLQERLLKEQEWK